MARRASRRQPMLPGLVAPMPGANAVVGGGDPPAHTGASLTARDLVTWQPARRSADADILPNQGPLIARSRDLERNSGIARGGMQTVVDNVVGTGLRLNPNPNYLALGKSKEWADEWSRRAKALWWDWAETTACDAADTMIFDQMTAQTLRAQLVNGDAFAIGLWRPDSRDGHATKIQTIDTDRLSTPSAMSESTLLRGGVQMNEDGAPVGYWIRKTHPGDYYVTGTLDGFGTWAFVPKRTSFGRRVGIHCYDKERSGQTRGKPILSSVLSNFKGLDRYTAAEIQAAVVNAMVAMIIETPLDQAGIEALFRNDKDAYLKARQEHAVGLESGSALALFPGDKANSFAPNRPSSQFGSFQENVGRIIALAYDMPYELLFKDFTKANYSSMRAAMLEAWRSFNRRRDDLGTQWADPVYMLVLEEWVNAGKIEAPDFYAMPYAYSRCNWIGPGRGMVDPAKEADAAATRIRTRISTYRDECAEQGRDWQEVFDQTAAENEYAASLNLPPVAAPSGSNPAGAAAAPAVSGDGQDAQDAADAADAGDAGDAGTSDAPVDTAGQTTPKRKAPAAAAPEIAALRESVLRLESAFVQFAGRPQAPTEVRFEDGAFRIEPVTHVAVAGDRSEERTVLERDDAGKPVVVQERFAATPPPPEPPPPPPEPPRAGTVVREVVKEVIERDAEGRILRVRETEVAT